MPENGADKSVGHGNKDQYRLPVASECHCEHGVHGKECNQVQTHDLIDKALFAFSLANRTTDDARIAFFPFREKVFIQILHDVVTYFIFQVGTDTRCPVAIPACDTCDSRCIFKISHCEQW